MMDSIVTCDLTEGIGKQLFQIATVLNYAKKHNKSPVFNNKVNALVTDNLYVLPDEEFKKLKFKIHQERIQNAYCDIPDYKGDVMLYGFFQAFQNVSKNTIKRMHELIYHDEFYMYGAYAEYNKIKDFFGSEDDNDYVAIHIKRNVSDNQNLLDLEYYKSAYNTITDCGKNNKNIIVFSDDIDWCKDHFKITDKMYYVELKHACVEFILMSFIQNNIIANSCFSWWATFISNYSIKSVVAPVQWYKSKLDRWDDLYPPGWIVI